METRQAECPDCPEQVSEEVALAARNGIRRRYCPNCWRSFPVGDWRLGARGDCFDCRAVLISPEQRQAGFEAAMRLADTETLKRWAGRERPSNRRQTARKILSERGL